MRHVMTGCALVASNNVGDESFLDSAELRSAVLDMVRTTLDALVEFTAPNRSRLGQPRSEGGPA
jgi:hypothetical protein